MENEWHYEGERKALEVLKNYLGKDFERYYESYKGDTTKMANALGISLRQD